MKAREYEVKLTLTDDEAEVLQSYIDRKRFQLEAAGLDDSLCWRAFTSVSHKIRRARLAARKEDAEEEAD